jgi:hypothetical protein
MGMLGRCQIDGGRNCSQVGSSRSRRCALRGPMTNDAMPTYY